MPYLVVWFVLFGPIDSLFETLLLRMIEEFGPRISRWFLGTKRNTPCIRTHKTMPVNGAFAWVPFCFEVTSAL